MASCYSIQGRLDAVGGNLITVFYSSSIKPSQIAKIAPVWSSTPEISNWRFPFLVLHYVVVTCYTTVLDLRRIILFPPKSQYERFFGFCILVFGVYRVLHRRYCQFFSRLAKIEVCPAYCVIFVFVSTSLTLCSCIRLYAFFSLYLSIEEDSRRCCSLVCCYI